MKKMDEMELAITLKGIKWSWIFMIIALFLWGVYDLVKTQSTSIPLILLSFQFLVYFFVTNISKWKVGDDDGKKALIWYLTGVILLIIAFGAILYFSTGK